MFHRIGKTEIRFCLRQRPSTNAAAEKVHALCSEAHELAQKGQWREEAEVVRKIEEAAAIEARF